MRPQHPSRTEPDRAGDPANGVSNRLLAKVGHELRTPLNVILGMLHLSLSEDVPAAARQYLETAKGSAVAMTTVLNDILDYSDVVSGTMPLASKPFSLRGTVGDAVDSVAEPASEKGLRLICRIQDDVPDQLVGDAVRLRQVLLYLLSNAVKFTDRGGRISVSCGTDTPDGEAIPTSRGPWTFLRVEDTGIGISAKEAETVFQPFVQVDPSNTRTQGGAGLGLAIARELARRMGGDLTLRSATGEGSRFTLWLPSAKPAGDGAD
jgi:signal transduction histidine kinase